MKIVFNIDALEKIFEIITQNPITTKKNLHKILTDKKLYYKSYESFTNDFKSCFIEVESDKSIVYIYKYHLPFNHLEITLNKNKNLMTQYLVFLNKWKDFIDDKVHMQNLELIKENHPDKTMLEQNTKKEPINPVIIKNLQASEPPEPVGGNNSEPTLNKNLEGVLFKLNLLENKILKIEHLIQEIYSHQKTERILFRSVIATINSSLDLDKNV